MKLFNILEKITLVAFATVLTIISVLSVIGCCMSF